MKVWRNYLTTKSSLLVGFFALAFIVSGVPIANEQESILIVEKAINPPRDSPGLGVLCRVLQIGVNRVTSEEHVVSIGESAVKAHEVRLISGKFWFRQDFNSDSSPYIGLFGTGAVNDGLRAELGPDDQIGILVERPTEGENEFSSIGAMAESMSDGSQRFEITIDFEQPTWTLSSGNSEMSLPTFRSKSCDDPRLGGGFDDSRNLSGEITMELEVEIEGKSRLVQITRSLARWSLVLGIGLVGFYFFRALSLRSNDSQA